MKYKMSKSIPKKGNNGMGIYMIEISTHVYVGSATCFFTRWQDHRKKCRKGNGVNKKFQNAYNKYGEDNVILSILEECFYDNIQDLLKREKYWIELLKPDLNINPDPTKIPITIINNQEISSKKVYQYDLDGNFITEYPSVREAARQLNVKSRQISAAAESNNRVKSAYGYQWSYTKLDYFSKYENNSDKAKIVPIYILDINELKETRYDSLADAVRSIGNYTNFDSACSTLSSVAGKKQSFYQLRYMARYEQEKYKFTNRKSAVYNLDDNKAFINAKVAAETYNLNRNTIRNWATKHKNNWIYLEDRARQKFRESEKNHKFAWSTLIEDL